jgi:hypothetical protein
MEVRTAVLKDGPTCAMYLRMQEAPIETRSIKAVRHVDI